MMPGKASVLTTAPSLLHKKYAYVSCSYLIDLMFLELDLYAGKKVKMLLIGLGSVLTVKNCDRGVEMQIPQYLGHSFSLYGPPSQPINNNVYF